MNNRPIGIIDSGVGGLSVWKEIVGLLPNENTIYLADSLYCPYGNRSNKEIHTLSRRLINFLVEQEVKAIVVACNTITVTALDLLRREFPDIPIIGTIPVVKTAVQVTKKGSIGIFSTTATATSAYQKKLIHTFAQGVEVVNKGTDNLVPLVEQGKTAGKEITTILEKELEDFTKAGVDVLALGCTHYPFLRKEIQQILGQQVTLLDSGSAIARQVERVLSANEAKNIQDQATHTLYTTGDVGTFQLVVNSLVGDIHADYQSISLV